MAAAAIASPTPNDRLQAELGRLARAAGHPVRWVGMDPDENADASRAAHLHGDRGPLRAMLARLVDAP